MLHNIFLDGPTAPGNAAESAHWACAHCTFENTEPRADCEMCGLPAN